MYEHVVLSACPSWRAEHTFVNWDDRHGSDVFNSWKDALTASSCAHMECSDIRQNMQRLSLIGQMRRGQSASRHLGHHVVVGRESAHHRVPSLVVGNQPLPVGERDAGGLLHADSEPIDRVVDLAIRNLRLVAASGDDRRLVHQVGERGAREADGPLRDDVELHVVRERFASRVHLQDGQPAVLVRQIDRHASIETARTEQCRIEDVSAVCGGDDDDAGVPFETVHLREDLVERLLALVVAAAHPAA
mmetsp:Transcript_23588/g.54605  ORF Transcript_23588/g.54605 Transcript_23588/m.54605 type:complete len:247 (-) Transcript_23588:993-1733(-)